jgi:hypothetical protein
VVHKRVYGLTGRVASGSMAAGPVVYDRRAGAWSTSGHAAQACGLWLAW